MRSVSSVFLVFRRAGQLCATMCALGREAAGLRRAQLLVWVKLQPGAVRGHTAAVRRLTAGVLALLRLVLHSGGRPLPNRLTLPLTRRRQDVEHQPSFGAAGVNLIAD